jgi:hypothetical protein
MECFLNTPPTISQPSLGTVNLQKVQIEKAKKLKLFCDLSTLHKVAVHCMTVSRLFKLHIAKPSHLDAMYGKAELLHPNSRMPNQLACFACNCLKKTYH